jgi:hypothetical protein
VGADIEEEHASAAMKQEILKFRTLLRVSDLRLMGDPVGMGMANEIPVRWKVQRLGRS